MDFFDILLAKKLKNDKDVSIVQLNVSENGTYSESGKAYSPVVVDVQPPSNSYLRTPIDSYPTTAEQLPIPKCDVEIANQKSCKVFVSNKPFVNDKVPYIYRKSAGGDRVYEKLIGGTIAWNQLVQSADTSCTLPNIHRYIARISGTWSIGTSDGTAITVDGSTGDMVFDITQMFGITIADYIYSLEQATAGAGVAWFRQMFPNDYYAYDSGSLQSVNVASKKVVGFNQWDEEWEVGNINTSGNNSSANDRIRTKNYNRILPNTTYYFGYSGNVDGVGGLIFFYDSNKTFISSLNKNANTTFTTPANAMYLRFRTYTAYGNVYRNDFCINISDASKNGTYEPYNVHTYALDSDLELRGLPKLDSNNNLYYDGDTYESNGTVTRRYGIVDLGSLNWIKFLDQVGVFTSTSDVDNMYVSGSGAVEVPIKCGKYVSGLSANELFDDDNLDNSIAANGVYPRFIVRDTSKNSLNPTEFAAAMVGVYVLYPLATQTSENADPFINPQIVDADGTEEFVDYAYSQSTRDVAVPVGHDSLYYNGQLYQTDFAQATTDTINMAELHSIVPPSGEFYITSNGTLSVDVWKK